MKEFLKYLKMIPVIIYPYIYVVILAVFLMFMNVLPLDYNGTARAHTRKGPCQVIPAEASFMILFVM